MTITRQWQNLAGICKFQSLETWIQVTLKCNIVEKLRPMRKKKRFLWRNIFKKLMLKLSLMK